MGLMDILQHYADASAPAHADASGHLEQVAQQAPTDVLSQGLAEAFRSDRTPPIGEMVGQLFGQSSPEQKAGMLQELLRAMPGLAGGGALGGLLGSLGSSLGGAPGGSPGTAPTAPQVTPAQANQVSPDAVQNAVEQAAKREPSIVDTLSQFYAQHPTLVRTLGTAAATIALAHMSQRMRQ